jgi:hypothetical protein
VDEWMDKGADATEVLEREEEEKEEEEEDDTT